MRSHVVAILMGAMLLAVSVGLPVAAASSAGSMPSAASLASTQVPVSSVASESSVAAVSSQPAVPAQSSDDRILLTTTLDRTPERTGEITATVSYELPGRVTELTARLPEDATVTGTDGFSQETGSSYAWDERTDRPSVTFRMRADRLTDDEGPLAEEGRYLFADTDEWALVRVPSIGAQWTRTGGEDDDLEFVRESAVDGAGIAGKRMAFLGPHRVESHTAHGQTFRLVVPEAAELEATPEEIFDSLSHASDALRVGDRDGEVLVIAAPTDSVEWGVRGLQTGDAELWVQDTERLNTPTNVWVHEYVHTRQAHVDRTTAETRWLNEAGATYYAALLTLEQSRIGFDEFSRYLEAGAAEPQSASTLSRPESWQNHANYEKGALVIGDLDRQIRLATDGEASFETVFRSLNGGRGNLTASGFEAAVADAATDEVGAAAAQYTTTDSTPTMWSLQDHTEAFGQQPASFAFRLTGPVEITGPDGSRTVSGSRATVAVGETLSAEVVAENVGGTAGNYELPFRVGNATEEATGQLGPGETATHTFEHTFAEPGQYTVSIGSKRIEVVVQEAEATGTDATTDESGDTETGSASSPISVETPGFGVIAALVGLVLLAGVAARRPA